MKKLFALIVMLVLVLASCSSQPSEPKGEKKGDEKLKIALLVGFLGDMSFNDSAYAGVERLREDFENVEVKVIEYGDQQDSFEPTFLDTAEGDYQMIITSSSMEEYIEKHAGSFKDKTFVIFDTSVNYDKCDCDNVYSIVYKANEGSFLGGFVAASISESGVIGFLGGIEQPIINDFLVGYIQGAKLAREDIKVAVSYVGSWNDSAKGKELTFAMFNQGADVAFNVAGGAGVGLIEASLEKDNFVIGVDSDQHLLFKNKGNDDYANVIITSVLKNVGDSIYRAVDLYLKNELKIGQSETLGLAEGGVGIANNEYFQSKVSQDVLDRVKEISEKITKGEIVIDTAYGQTTEAIQEIRESVKP